LIDWYHRDGGWVWKEDYHDYNFTYAVRREIGNRTVLAISANRTASAPLIRFKAYDLTRLSSSVIQTSKHLTVDNFQMLVPTSFDVSTTVQSLALPTKFKQGGRIYVEIGMLHCTCHLSGSFN
jgi:hypothetical protein